MVGRLKGVLFVAVSAILFIVAIIGGVIYIGLIGGVFGAVGALLAWQIIRGQLHSSGTLADSRMAARRARVRAARRRGRL